MEPGDGANAYRQWYLMVAMVNDGDDDGNDGAPPKIDR